MSLRPALENLNTIMEEIESDISSPESDEVVADVTEEDEIEEEDSSDDETLVDADDDADLSDDEGEVEETDEVDETEVVEDDTLIDEVEEGDVGGSEEVETTEEEEEVVETEEDSSEEETEETETDEIDAEMARILAESKALMEDPSDEPYVEPDPVDDVESFDEPDDEGIVAEKVKRGVNIGSNSMFSMESIQSAFAMETVEQHEEQDAKFSIRKPVLANPPGLDKKPSDNYVEKYVNENDKTVIDLYINAPWGTFVSFFHMLLLASEDDIVNIYLNSGIYSEDASILLNSMDICKAPVNVYVGFIEGFYGACIVAKADKRFYTDISAIFLNPPATYLTLRGLSSVEQQINYMKNNIERFVEVLIENKLSTREEIDEIILKNKSKLLKRDDLAKRLSDKPLDVPE